VQWGREAKVGLKKKNYVEITLCQKYPKIALWAALHHVRSNIHTVPLKGRCYKRAVLLWLKELLPHQQPL